MPNWKPISTFPTERAADIRMGLPVQIVTSTGELIESTKIYFISQQVDNAIQGILVKAPIHASLDKFRNAQLVKARVIWSTAPAPTVPVLAVTRIGGQSFVYVATQADNGTRRQAACGYSRRYDRQRLCRQRRPEARGKSHHLRHAVPHRRCAGYSRSASQPDFRRNSRERRSRRGSARLVDFFIKRPIFATVCALLIILAGAVSIPGLPISLYPDLAPPQVTVTSNYVGANAQVVESAVTIPLEQQINGVEGMHYITSTSSNDGTSNINVTFRTGYDLNIAAVDVQNRVATAQGRLPQEIKNTGVTITKANPNFVFAAGFYSPDNSLSNQYISNYLDVYVKDALKRIPGVGDVVIFGERKYAMRIWLDPTKLAARQLTAADVVARCRSRTSKYPPDSWAVRPPIPSRISRSRCAWWDGSRSRRNSRTSSSRTRPMGSCSSKMLGRAEIGAESYDTNLMYSGHEADRCRRAAALECQRARGRQSRQGRAERAVEVLSARHQVRDRLRHDDGGWRLGQGSRAPRWKKRSSSSSS